MKAEVKDRPEEKFPPAFWSPPTGEDMSALSEMHRGRRFDGSLVLAVARRCRHGFPQVTVCSPAASDGSPFPTLFWLSCPYLVQKCGELESRQLIAELEAIFAAMPERIAQLHESYAKLREKVLRESADKMGEQKRQKTAELLSNAGVGGINWRTSISAVKCLHLQTAAWLGLGWHPASGWLAENIGALECENGYCSEFKKIFAPH